MPKVRMHFGITLPGQKEYSSVRADVEFELDADGDIEAQLKECLAAVKKGEEPLEGALVQQVANLGGIAIEGTGVAAEFAEFAERIERRLSNTIGEVKRHKDKLEALNAAGLIKAKKPKAPKEAPAAAKADG